MAKRFEVVRTDKDNGAETLCGQFEADYLDVYEYSDGNDRTADQPSDIVIAVGYEDSKLEDRDDDIIAIAVLQPGMYIRKK